MFIGAAIEFYGDPISSVAMVGSEGIEPSTKRL